MIYTYNNFWNTLITCQIDLISVLLTESYLGTAWAPQNVEDIEIGTFGRAFSKTWSIFNSVSVSSPYPDLHSTRVVPETNLIFRNVNLLSLKMIQLFDIKNKSIRILIAVLSYQILTFFLIFSREDLEDNQVTPYECGLQ